MSSVYIESKIDGKKYCKTNGHFTRHLSKYKLTYQGYYEKYISKISPKCSCGNSLSFYQKNETYANSCGNPMCVGKTISNTKQNWTDKQKAADSRHKSIAANLRTPEQIQEQIAKSQKTQIKKYGCVSAKTDSHKAKSKATKLAKYGNEYYAGWEKSAKKNRNKTLEEQNSINDKRRKTNLERFGVECVWLLAESKSKSAKSNAKGKDYVLPSGNVIGIRGYENKVLDTLFEQGYVEEDLVIHDGKSEYKLPVFDYITVENQHHRYFPDIFIPKENKIIEVKGMWWWNANNHDGYAGRIVNNLRKKDAVIMKGYEYEVWLFTDKSKYEVIKTKQDFEKWAC